MADKIDFDGLIETFSTDRGVYGWNENIASVAELRRALRLARAAEQAEKALAECLDQMWLLVKAGAKTPYEIEQGQAALAAIREAMK